MKKILLSLFVCVVGFISFCSAFVVSLGGGYFDSPNTTGYFEITPINGSTITYGGYTYNAIRFRDNPSVNGYYVVSYSAGSYNLMNLGPSQRATLSAGDYDISCSSNPCVVAVRFSNPVNVLSGMCPSCPSQYTSEECQSEYNLVSSSDLTTCQSSLSSCQSSLSGWNNTLNNCSNNLLSCESSLASCIQSNCPIDTGDVMWSSLWINGIQHLGKSVINVSIPDNIHWDYTTNDESFDLFIGSGYDQEYIDSVLSINSYRPTSQDFTYMFVSGLTLIFPYIFLALLIIFIWKLIKRIFK